MIFTKIFLKLACCIFTGFQVAFLKQGFFLKYSHEVLGKVLCKKNLGGSQGLLPL